MGQESLKNDAKSEQPVEIMKEDKVTLMEKLVRSDQHLKIKKMAETAKLSLPFAELAIIN